MTIRRDGTTVIESSHSEQGQGILTGIMSAIVDEADSDWDKVEIYEAGLSSEAPYIAHSITGGFTMMDDLARFRHAGATIRTMMKTAAANTWKVPVEEIETHKGVASHKASGKTATYGDLVSNGPRPAGADRHHAQDAARNGISSASGCSESTSPRRSTARRSIPSTWICRECWLASR